MARNKSEKGPPIPPVSPALLAYMKAWVKGNPVETDSMRGGVFPMSGVRDEWERLSRCETLGLSRYDWGARKRIAHGTKPK